MPFTYTQCYDNNLISDEVLECLPSECPACGNEVMFTSSLVHMFCPNRVCPAKIGDRMESMAKQLKIVGMGGSSCIKIAETFDMKSPLQVVLLDTNLQCNVAKFSELVGRIKEATQKPLQVWEFVQLANIPGVDTISYKLFKGYASVHEAYEDIERDEVVFVADKLGLRDSKSSVLAIETYNTLVEYGDELKTLEKYFNIVHNDLPTYEIAITNSVSNFTNKSEFIDYLNMRYSGKATFIMKNSVSNTVFATVYDGGPIHSKYTKTERMIEKGLNILLVTSEELVEELDSILLR